MATTFLSRWIPTFVRWCVYASALVCCFHLAGIWGVAIPLVWGAVLVGAMESATRSASPQAWQRDLGNRPSHRVWFIFATMVLAPSILIGVGYGITVDAFYGLGVGVAAGVVTLAGGAIGASAFHRICGPPGSQREPMRRPRQFTTRFVLMATAIVACCVLVFSELLGPIFPQSRLRLIQPGMTEQEVIGLLGDPTQRTTDGYLVYERWGNPGWVVVCFGKDGLVCSIDDESAFP